MAYFLYKGLEERQEQFIVESVSDISKLPTATSDGDSDSAKDGAHKRVSVGSMALCLETGDVYILNTQNKWVIFGESITPDNSNIDPEEE